MIVSTWKPVVAVVTYSQLGFAVRKSVPCFFFNFESASRSNRCNPSRNFATKVVSIHWYSIKHRNNILSKMIDFMGVLTLFLFIFKRFIDKNFNTTIPTCFLVTRFSNSVKLSNTILQRRSAKYKQTNQQTSSQDTGIGIRLQNHKNKNKNKNKTNKRTIR